MRTRWRHKKFITPKAIILNSAEDILKSDTLSKVDPYKYFVDYYVDKKDFIAFGVLRLINKKDLEFLESTLNGGLFEFEHIDQSCTELCYSLAEVYRRDQEIRGKGEPDQSVDFENLNVVLNIIKKCGFDRISKLSYDDISIIWIVLQHAPHKYRVQYFPDLKKLNKRGLLDDINLMMMKDRILMESGKPQLYGTQVFSQDGRWMLWELEDTLKVDSLRFSIGLDSLNVYLDSYNIDWTNKKLK